jgi:hypothetical protein
VQILCKFTGLARGDLGVDPRRPPVTTNPFLPKRRPGARLHPALRRPKPVTPVPVARVAPYVLALVDTQILPRIPVPTPRQAPDAKPRPELEYATGPDAPTWPHLYGTDPALVARVLAGLRRLDTPRPRLRSTRTPEAFPDDPAPHRWHPAASRLGPDV